MNPQMNQDDLLDRRLTAEARDASPVFSQDLHARIMSRIHAAPAANGWRLRPLYFSTLAAAAMIAVGVFIYLHSIKPASLPHPKEIAIRPVPSVPAMKNPIRQMDQPTVTEWTSDRYAYLDRDGEKFISYISRQLDVAPQKR